MKLITYIIAISGSALLTAVSEVSPSPHVEGVPSQGAAPEALVAGVAKSLFNGKDLSGWVADIPRADKDPSVKPSFIVRDGKLVSLGEPRGHLISEGSFQDYTLEIEYRFPGEPGNCGVLVHVSKLRVRGNMFPQSLEVQMMHQDAGDFWCIGEDIKVPDMEARRPRAEGQQWGVSGTDARRILNLNDGAEKPLGEWNHMKIQCLGDRITVWVNGILVNDGTGCTARAGKIALQAEGAEVEFRKIEITGQDQGAGIQPGS